MNVTYLFLSLQNELGGGPFIQSKYRLSLDKSKFSRFSIPLSFAPQYLSIQTSTFSKFLEQVIKQSKTDNKKSVFKCSSFKDIFSLESGAVFNLENTEIQVEKCSFLNVVSNTSGACFYAYQSNIGVIKCTFRSCHASGGNAKYGNAYFAEKCNFTLSYSYTLLCAPSVEESGDSTIAAILSTELNVKYLNSSNSRGNSGSASITCRQSTCDSCYISYLTVTDAVEHNTLEISLTNNSYISFANFINSTKCSGVINNNNINMSIFDNCAFINSAKNLSTLTRSTTIYFTNCYSNDFDNIEGITKTTDTTYIDLKFTFLTVPNCSRDPNKFFVSHTRNILKAFSISLLYSPYITK